MKVRDPTFLFYIFVLLYVLHVMSENKRKVVQKPRIGHEAFTKSMWEKIGIGNSKAVSAPVNPGTKLKKTTECGKQVDPFYQSALDSCLATSHVSAQSQTPLVINGSCMHALSEWNSGHGFTLQWKKRKEWVRWFFRCRLGRRCWRLEIDNRQATQPLAGEARNNRVSPSPHQKLNILH